MKSWLKGGLIGGGIGIFPIILGLILDTQIKEESLGLIIFFLPSIAFWGVSESPFILGFSIWIYFSFLFNLVVGFFLGSIIGLIIGKIKNRNK